uniref:D,D-heptose 1,7-bisphosphate phosphatase n=1 Tax=Rubrivivax gelatinosus S1 TaxID=1138313 RepID=L8BAQ5_RUBGE|nr:D,D-heptose 1,7-bisphosphate phosphatase [Rubrivivax gelatinosus S1]
MTGLPALFLDRDGVINVEKRYVHRIEDFEFLPGIFALCTAAQGLGHALVVVTNQAGIARGLYGEDDFRRLTVWMLERFLERDIRISRVYHCPHHPTAGLDAYRHDCFDRKPNPGMLLRARDELGLDLAASSFVGDKDSDMQAGAAAGVGLLLKLQGGPADAEPGAPVARAIEVASLEQASVLFQRHVAARG